MAHQTQSVSLPHATAILWADVMFEIVVGILALWMAIGGVDWFGVSRAWLFVIAAAFGAAAVAITPLLRQPQASAVARLGWANTFGGVALWCVAIVYWTTWTPAAQWVLAAVADGFIVLGVLELLAVRRGLIR